MKKIEFTLRDVNIAVVYDPSSGKLYVAAAHNQVDDNLLRDFDELLVERTDKQGEKQQ